MHRRYCCIAHKTNSNQLAYQEADFVGFFRSFRAGTVILALHDVSDIFMELAKLFKYCRSELGASICFGLFVLSWVLLRLIYFPFWVIWSTRSFFCAPPFFLFCESCHRYIFRQTSKFCVVREVKNLNKRESWHCAVQFSKHTGQYQSTSL